MNYVITLHYEVYRAAAGEMWQITFTFRLSEENENHLQGFDDAI